jgi:hypothetical protein
MNNRVFRHILMPAVMPAIFLAVVAAPVDVLGCRNRGLAVFAIAFLSVLAALVATVIGVRRRFRGEPDALAWVVTALILTLPSVLLLLLA